MVWLGAQQGELWLNGVFIDNGADGGDGGNFEATVARGGRGVGELLRSVWRTGRGQGWKVGRLEFWPMGVLDCQRSDRAARQRRRAALMAAANHRGRSAFRTSATSSPLRGRA